MKKLFRMALVLALAGSALLYTSCTKDYSPDIQSLQDQINAINTDPNSGLPWVRTQLESLSSTLSGLQSKVTIGDDELNNRISTLRSELNSAIGTINSALAGKADQSYVADQISILNGKINDLKTDLEARLDDIDGEEGRLAALEDAIEALNSASAAIEGQFGTYAKFIQSIAFVPANTFGYAAANVYKFVTDSTSEAKYSDAILVASFKITPSEARSRATMESSNLVAVQTKAAAAAPDTLEITKLEYRDDAPGYVDVYAKVDTSLFNPSVFAFAFVVTQTEDELEESVTSDYAQAYLNGPRPILFQIYDAEEGDIVDPYTYDDEVRVSPSTDPKKVKVYTADRWSVVADIDGAYLTPEEAKDLFGVSDIKLVSPLAGDTAYDYAGNTDYYEYTKKAFDSQVGPKSGKKFADLVNNYPTFLLAVYLKNSHAGSGYESGYAVGTYHAVPDTVAYPLTPVDLYGQATDVIIPWDYKNYNNIKDTLIAKIKVPADCDRDMLIGAEADSTWNSVTGTDVTEGVGATTPHTNDSNAIDKVLVSSAAYGEADSVYVYQIKHYEADKATLYTGEFEYTVAHRPEDLVIEFGPIDTMVRYEKVKTVIPFEGILEPIRQHADYYANYPLDTVAVDFKNGVQTDSCKVTLDGEEVALSACGLGGSFAYDPATHKDGTSINLYLNRPGEWKVYLYQTFAGVHYTEVVIINVTPNPARIAPKETYVTVDSPENPKDYSVQVKGDVDTTTYHYYLIDQPFQDYIKVVDYAVGSDSLIVDVKTITANAVDSVKAPATPVGLERLASDSTMANLADTTNFEWGTWDSLEFKVAVRLIPEVDQTTNVDSATVRLWTVDPIPVFDGGDGIVVEHEKDQLAKTNIIAGINIVDFQGIALNDSTGLRPIGPDAASGELVVDYDQEIEIGEIELISGADYLEELQLFFDPADPEVLCLRLNQGVIVTPIVVRIPIKLSYMLDRGMEDKNTVYVYVTFVEKED